MQRYRATTRIAHTPLVNIPSLRSSAYSARDSADGDRDYKRDRHVSPAHARREQSEKRYLRLLQGIDLPLDARAARENADQRTGASIH